MPAPPSDPAELALVRAAVADPAGRTTWLVYADWLDEHDKPDRAEFLRAQVRLAGLPADDPGRAALAARAAELRAVLHPLWVAFFDQPPVENCRGAGLFDFECPQRWDALAPTADVAIRHCGACDKPVHYCHDLDAARAHAGRGECVAVSLGVPRRPGDLTPPADPDSDDMVMGEFAAEAPPPDWSARVTMGVMAVPPERPWWRFW